MKIGKRLRVIEIGDRPPRPHMASPDSEPLDADWPVCCGCKFPTPWLRGLGLCYTCYPLLTKLVKARKTTWAKLHKIGLITHLPFRGWTPRHRTRRR